MTTIEEIYAALTDEYDGKLFSDNFLRVNVENKGGQIVVGFDMAKPEDLDAENPGDMDWWQDKIDSAVLFYGDVVKFLVDNFGEEFDFNEIGVDDEYVNKANYKGAFKVEQDQYADDEMPTITISENARQFNERTTYFNTAEMESALFAALNKMGGVIEVKRTNTGYIVYTQDKDFQIDLDIRVRDN